MSLLAVNNLRSIQEMPDGTFLEKLAYKKAHTIGLTCIEMLADWFLTICCCCFSSYNDLCVKAKAAQCGVVDLCVLDTGAVNPNAPLWGSVFSNLTIYDHPKPSISGAIHQIFLENPGLNTGVKPQISFFPCGATLADFTTNGLAAVGTSTKSRSTNDLHEYLIINKRKVLFYESSSSIFHTKCHVRQTKDSIVVTQHLNSVQIVESSHGVAGSAVIVHLDRPYQRTYIDEQGKTRTEDIYIAGIKHDILANNEELRKSLSLVWPPV